MQKQMIVTVPEELFEYSEGNHEILKQVSEACSDFLKGKGDVIIMPSSFSYEIKDVDSDISEVVITYDRGE